eukprot:GAFH01002339.1.p1 GENE.GAFH01002339.1~~GAFH01002339.1.p1  ORF type:complete len:378 (+),score=20.06 GAFH01002339.1:169-1134(+)
MWQRARKAIKRWSVDQIAKVDFAGLKRLEQIGHGAFGEVFRADFNGTIVAVKSLYPQQGSSEQIRQFDQEVALLRTLRHPYVVSLIGATTEEPRWIVTEYLENGSLSGILRDPKRELPMELRLRMAFDMARGVSYLHSLHPPLFHRDIKSQNMLVTGDMRVKVADFGISRMSHEASARTTAAAGTMGWASPEVLQGNSHAWLPSDVYSFGVVLWELVTRQEPWAGVAPLQAMNQVVAGVRPPLPPDDDSGFPSAFMALLRQCWDQSPEARPTMRQVVDVLGAEVRLHPYKPLAKKTKKSGKRVPKEMASIDLHEHLLPGEP